MFQLQLAMRFLGALIPKGVKLQWHQNTNTFHMSVSFRISTIFCTFLWLYRLQFSNSLSSSERKGKTSKIQYIFTTWPSHDRTWNPKKFRYVMKDDKLELIQFKTKEKLAEGRVSMKKLEHWIEIEKFNRNRNLLSCN